MTTTKFADGYQAALADIATALDRGGEDAVREWLANNRQVARAADAIPAEGEQANTLPDRMATFPRDGYTRLIYAAREDADTVAEHYRAIGARVETPDVWTVDVYGPDIDDTAAWQEWVRRAER